jgi:hypothetical protein
VNETTRRLAVRALDGFQRLLAMGLALLGLFTDSSERILFAIFMWMVVESAGAADRRRGE